MSLLSRLCGRMIMNGKFGGVCKEMVLAYIIIIIIIIIIT
jgi:hypothetical protein